MEESANGRGLPTSPPPRPVFPRRLSAAFKAYIKNPMQDGARLGTVALKLGRVASLQERIENAVKEARSLHMERPTETPKLRVATRDSEEASDGDGEERTEDGGEETGDHPGARWPTKRSHTWLKPTPPTQPLRISSVTPRTRPWLVPPHASIPTAIRAHP